MPNIDYKKESRIFKALGHPTRLAIVETLIHGEKCVHDIQELLKASQPNISQHLNNLKYADIVDFRQEGNLRCYFLKKPKKMKLLINALK
jgi:ArsR family transcriptional regulator